MGHTIYILARKLWEVLHNTNMNHTLVKLVQTLNKDIKSFCQAGNTFTKTCKNGQLFLHPFLKSLIMLIIVPNFVCE